MPASAPSLLAALQRIEALLIEGRSDAAESLADSLVALAGSQASPSATRFMVLDSLTACVAARSYPVLALRFGAPLRALADSVLAPTSPDMARMLRRHGMLLAGVGDLEAAASEVARGVALAERAPVPATELADMLEDLAFLYGALAVPDTVRVLLERCLDIRQRAFGEFSFPVANTLAALASTYFRGEGNYATGLATLERAIAVAEQIDPESPGLLKLYNLQGVMFGMLHDVARANQLFRRCVALAIRAYGTPHHREVARFLNNVGRSEYDMGHYEAARAVHDSALAIRTLIRDTGVGESLLNLGLVAMQTGRLDEADSLLRLALNQKEYLTPLWIANVRSQQFRLYLMSGRLAAAESVLVMEMAARSKVSASIHPTTIEAFFRQALLHQARGDTLDAYGAAMKVDSLDRFHFALTARAVSERQVLDYWETRPPARDLAMSLAPWLLSPGTPARLWDAVIRSRGQICDEMAQRQRALSAQADTTVTRLRSELARAQAAYGHRLSRPLGSASEWDSLIHSSRDRIERLESRLGQLSMAFRADLRRHRIGLEEVRSALPDDAALVAFVLYRHLRPAGSRDGPESIARYAAFVQPAKHAEPQIVPLGPASTVDSLVLAWRAAVIRGARGSAGRLDASRAAGMRLRRTVWDPFATMVRGARTVFVVPDGLLGLINFAALPTRNERYLIEDGPIVHSFSTERDLVPEASRATPGHGLLVVAAPDFDAEPMAATSVPAGTMTAAASGRTFRGLDVECADAAGLDFAPLPAAAREGTEVLRTWRGALGHEPARTLTGAAAGERVFKTVSEGMRMVHLATHGFFLNPRCESQPFPDAPLRDGMSGHPLRLAGLALAGANRRLEARVDDEDGILTAEEISSLDLNGVEWVVLSACDTGLGDVRAGEGIFGLRRAFAVAGVGTTIMSLWPVEDFTSRQWMAALYRARLLEKRSTAESVRSASLDLLTRLRGRGAGTEPGLWAPFVASGDWR